MSVRRAKPLCVCLTLAMWLAACGTSRESEQSRQPAASAASFPRDAAENIIRSQGESAAQLARRVIPPGAETAFDPVELACGPPGASVVILFRASDSLSNYTGWVLYPADGGSMTYRKTALPAMDEASGLFDITVKGVFAADKGVARVPHLVVLYQYYRTGSGGDPGYAAYVYTWNNGSFVIDRNASMSVAGLRDEQAVRSRLASAP